MSMRGWDKLVPLIALLVPIQVARAQLPEAMPRTVPSLGRWTAWVAAEVEYQWILNSQPVGDQYSWPWIHKTLDPLRQLAMADPAAAELFAMLSREHTSEQLRAAVVMHIIEPRNASLRSPNVRKTLWTAVDEGKINRLYAGDVYAALPLFGRDQLKPLSDEELLVQLKDLLGSYPRHGLGDAMYELYMLEVVQRRLNEAVPLLERGPLAGSVQRRLLIRTAHNRLLGRPDPIAFKARRDPDDPTVCHMEFVVADRAWMDELLTYVLRDRPRFSFDIYLKTGDKRQLWQEKWPPLEALRRGQPVRTATTTALIQQPHQLEIKLRLEGYYYSLESTEKPTYALPEGPTLLPATTVMVDMSAPK